MAGRAGGVIGVQGTHLEEDGAGVLVEDAPGCVLPGYPNLDNPIPLQPAVFQPLFSNPQHRIVNIKAPDPQTVDT
jgi:hypothetical protein